MAENPYSKENLALHERKQEGRVFYLYQHLKPPTNKEVLTYFSVTENYDMDDIRIGFLGENNIFISTFYEKAFDRYKTDKITEPIGWWFI